jgi:hypothetical protein
MFTIQYWETLILVYNLRLRLKICPKTGFALFAGQQRVNLTERTKSETARVRMKKGV